MADLEKIEKILKDSRSGKVHLDKESLYDIAFDLLEEAETLLAEVEIAQLLLSRQAGCER